MSTLLSKSLAACGFALAAASLITLPAAAADDKKPAKAAAKPVKAKAKAAAKDEAPEAVADGPDADITDTVTADYNCELGNKITIFANEKDDSHIALRWKKRIHRLDRVGTTTGARRFENKTFGLIWIGIPAKGMLLDSKLNRQLANECKSADQERAANAPKIEKQTEQPSSEVKVKVEPIVPPQALPPMTPAPAVAPAVDPAQPKATPL
jgi:membrane-bound inhibitor of C-type lysozyme